MKPHPVFLTDLLLLHKVFDPQSGIIIYDPELRLDTPAHPSVSIVNHLPSEIPQGFLCYDISKGKNDISIYNDINAKQVTLHYINNPDQTIRWIIPGNCTHPGYLTLYNSETLKARLYKTITRIAWSVGKESLLASGTISLQQNLLDQVKKSCGVSPEEEVSFFTGTRGDSRKVVMEIHRKGICLGFVKIPISDVTEKMVQNENRMLADLNRYDFTTLSFPNLSKKINGRARLGNVRPSVIIPADRITAIHIKAIAELYTISRDRKPIADTEAWFTIQDHMEWLKREIILNNGLDAFKTRRLITLLRKLYHSIPVDYYIPVSVSHGDFTPWNMYCDEQRLYVYDWELAKNGIPMMFDLFHFTFQTTVLRERKSYIGVKSSLKKWMETPLAKKLQEKYRIDMQLHFRLYLLFTISYYLRQYICQKELLIQSNWMIHTWLEALEDISKSIDNKLSEA